MTRALTALAAYAELHARLLDPADRSAPKRFLLLPEEKIWHGLGNQQLTWLYGLLAALLSGRALLGRPFHGAEDCYDFPIRLDPAGLERLGIERAALGQPAEYPGWASAQDLAFADPTDFGPPRYVSRLDGQIAAWDERRGIPHAVFAPVNPHHRENLRETFGDDLLQSLARYLFRPSPRIRAAAADIEGRMRGRFALGLQLRCGFSSFDLYLSSPRARRLFWSAAQAVLAEQKNQEAVVFLATDSMDARADARTVFGDRLLHLPGPVAPDGDPFTAVLDQHLLTQCDALVVTERSTFGYGAHLLSGIAPWAVDGKLGTVRKRPDSRSGLYKASPWEAPSTWPWQERELARCPGFTPEMSRKLDPDFDSDRRLRGARAALRWLLCLELPIAGSAAIRRWRRAVGV